MRDLKAQNSHTYFLAWAHFLDAFGHSLGKEGQLAIELFVKVEKIVYLFLGNAEHMPFGYRIDVEKSKAFLSFGHFVARDFPCHNL
jgi:hypothetical protein